MANTIKKLTIEGYKTIRMLKEFPLGALNVLIGANGAGKSNFVGFFRLLRELIEQRLQLALQTVEGGADACLYLGPKITKQFAAKLCFGDNEYEFALAPTPDNQLVFSMEIVSFGGRRRIAFAPEVYLEARLRDYAQSAPNAGSVFDSISNWAVYHFNDTSLTAAVRRPRALNDNETLRQNAENLAPFLYRIQQTNPSCYTKIRDVVRSRRPCSTNSLRRTSSWSSELTGSRHSEGSIPPTYPHGWKNTRSGNFGRKTFLEAGLARTGSLSPSLEAIAISRVYVIVEGPTEEFFVKGPLAKVLLPRGVYVKPIILGVPGHKGGRTSYARGKKDVLVLLKQDLGSYCTTMFDYYGLGLVFPKRLFPRTSATSRRSSTSNAR